MKGGETNYYSPTNECSLEGHSPAATPKVRLFFPRVMKKPHITALPKKKVPITVMTV